MAKRIDSQTITRLATATGHLAGSVEGAVQTVVESIHHSVAGDIEPIHPDVKAEMTDLHYRGVLIGGICLVTGMWLSVGLLFFYFQFLKQHRDHVSPPPLPLVRNGIPLPPQPGLQASPETDLKTYRAVKDWQLSHYYWLDKSKGRVAIPIEQAIQTLAKQGIPPAHGAANSTGTPPEQGTRLTGFEGKVEPEPR